MSPPVITWFFNPALALWPSPHDEAETTGGIEGAIVSDLERASPASGRFTNRPYVASPSLCERDGIVRLACKAEPALTLRIRTLQLQAPS